jgi:hypothetical protein
MARGKTIFTQSAVARILKGIEASGVKGTVVFDLQNGRVEFQMGVIKSAAEPNEWDEVATDPAVKAWNDRIAGATFDAQRKATNEANKKALAAIQAFEAATDEQKAQWQAEQQAWHDGATDRRRERRIAKLSPEQRSAVLDGPLDQMNNLPKKIRKILLANGMLTLRAVVEKTPTELLSVGFPNDRLFLLTWELARWGLSLSAEPA